MKLEASKAKRNYIDTQENDFILQNMKDSKKHHSILFKKKNRKKKNKKKKNKKNKSRKSKC